MAINELKTGTLWHQRAQAVLFIKGPEALDFLQRMSTNDLLGKLPLATSFINSKGRMVDYVVVFPEKDGYLLLSSHQDPQILFDWLEKFHFIEDFSLEVEPKPCFYVFAKDCQSQSGNLVFETNFLVHDLIKVHVLLGEQPQGEPIDAAIFDTLRIAALMPLAPSEINDAYMPQNINLLSSIAQKGCYIGQEVILKALTYQKNVKILEGQKLSFEDYSNEDLGPYSSRAPLFYEGFFNALTIGFKP